MSRLQIYPLPQQKLGDKLIPLAERRNIAAMWAYEVAPLNGVEDQGGWVIEDDVMTRPVLWLTDNENEYNEGLFGIRFAPDSDQVIDWWWQ